MVVVCLHGIHVVHYSHSVVMVMILLKAEIMFPYKY